ncbi:hypothetical protein [uncultured Algimonas sp.]|nr:hypothetical protein [uncultured Algimonas sp.]
MTEEMWVNLYIVGLFLFMMVALLYLGSRIESDNADQVERRD